MKDACEIISEPPHPVKLKDKIDRINAAADSLHAWVAEKFTDENIKHENVKTAACPALLLRPCFTSSNTM
jgi:hypothetical protein